MWGRRQSQCWAAAGRQRRPRSGSTGQPGARRSAEHPAGQERGARLPQGRACCWASSCPLGLGGFFSHCFVASFRQTLGFSPSSAEAGLGFSRSCLLYLSSSVSPSKYCDRAQGLEQQLIAIPLVLRAGPAASRPPAAARSLCTRQQGAVEPSLGTAARNVVGIPTASLC